MRRLTLVVVGVGAAVGTAAMPPRTARAQEKTNAGLRLSVVGIAVKDYPKSQNFYGKIVGFPVAFTFSTPDGSRTTTYYQTSRDTFLEMQAAFGDVQPGVTHAHLLTDDLSGTIARLRQAGLPAATGTTPMPNTMGTTISVSGGSHVKNVNVFDPDGLRLELNEYLPDSLTTKASKSWDASRPSLTLSVFGIAVKNYPESQTFYEKTMGFRVAFTFPNAAGQVVNTYYQEGRDSFMEMQLPAANGHPGFTHAHFVTNDLAGTIARLRLAGLAAATPGAPQMPGTIGEKINVSPGAKTKNVNVVDPDGIRLELNEYDGNSLPRKAIDTWK
jgi:catechol 2,3-dioxygenase-like lactoylglutathione lyase family enzyme